MSLDCLLFILVVSVFHCLISFFSFSFCLYFIYFFREREGKGEGERETLIHCLLHTPKTGHMSWMGIEPGTFWWVDNAQPDEPHDQGYISIFLLFFLKLTLITDCEKNKSQVRYFEKHCLLTSFRQLSGKKQTLLSGLQGLFISVPSPILHII